MGGFPVILIDTNVLLFSMQERSRLTGQAANALESADEILFSSISIREIGIKNQKGNLPLPFNLEEMIYHLESVENLTIVPIDARIRLKNIALEWDHRDPADRTIVATALLKNVPIVTADRYIRDFYSRTIW
ncbi:MAG: type II toxin-antitoxin system VapC family toxin [Spirochaetaceae bacterium]|nr:type II toxin-antitoxin system VapC family toxin [Spirochaetaceae bacterium]